MIHSKFKYLGLIVISLSLIYISCTASNEVLIDKKQFQPLAYYPQPQNGYGSGSDQLAQPDDVELLPDGRVLITDVDNDRIQLFSEDGNLLKTINASTLGLEGTTVIPTGLAADAKGFIYVSLEGAGCVARLTPELELDQFIGTQGKVTADQYYLPENANLLISPQGLIVNARGDVFVIDMSKKIFATENRRNFGFRKFKLVSGDSGVTYQYDTEYAETQEVTKIMRKSEGLAISEEHGLLFVAEEKPTDTQFGNSEKYRYIGVFDLETGKYENRLIGVEMSEGKIVSGYCDDSIEGLSVLGDYLFAVVEKDGRVDCYDIDSGKRLTHFGTEAPFYCDDESDCIIEGVNYNEQNIIAGGAQIHLLNDWQKSELASPDGVCAKRLASGKNVVAVVDQWNSRILTYDMDALLRNQ